MDNESNITASFHNASELVKSWGEAALPGGRTVEELLTIEGISLWAAVSSMLAFGHLSRALSFRSRPAILWDLCRTLARKGRQVAFDVGMPFVAGRNDREGWLDRPSFLFLGFSPYIYRETLQPVAERIAGKSGYSAVVLDDTWPPRSGRTIERGVIPQSLWRHWDPGVAKIAKRMRKVLKSTTDRMTAPSGLPEIVASSGVSWTDVRQAFDWLFDAYLPRLTTLAAVALHILERHRPALLISPDVNDPRTRVFCLAGRLAGVRTLEVQFGFYGRNDIEWRFFIADHLAVTGESNLEVMIEHGIPRGRMTVTGSPRYDSALFRSSEPTRTGRHDMGIPDGKAIVLFASQPYYFGVFGDPEIRRNMMRALFRAASESEGLVLVVKPHPLEDPAEAVALAKGGRNILFVDKRLDIRNLIRDADAFVTFFSSTTFDALVMNKPTINLSFPGGCANKLFERCGATFVARTADDVSRMLRSIGNGRIAEDLGDLASARERFLRNWFYQLDGQAAERIESIALGMATFQGAGGVPRVRTQV